MKIILSIAILLILKTTLYAQEAQPAADATVLAKETQNPVSSLISLPFQFNFNSGGGLGDATLFNLNFQPVIPFKLNEDWNMIARTIVPVLSIPVAGRNAFQWNW